MRYTRVRGVQAREAASKHTVADTAIAATAGSRDNSPNVDDSDRYSATTRTRRRWRFSLRGRRSRRAKTGPHDDAIYLPARFINAKRFVAILQASVNSLRISALVSAHISAHSLSNRSRRRAPRGTTASSSSRSTSSSASSPSPPSHSPSTGRSVTSGSSARTRGSTDESQLSADVRWINWRIGIPSFSRRPHHDSCTRRMP